MKTEILNFLCFYDFYNKCLQYAKEITQEDVGLSNNFALLTKNIPLFALFYICL